MTTTEQKGSVLGATLLVAGTCIGGGMLALPVATGRAGFFPSFFMMLLGWAFMTITALYLAEVNLWMEKGAHVITMASRMLGPVGKAVAWVLYLFIGYASLVAYTAGGKDLLKSGVDTLFGINLSDAAAIIIFVAIFILILYFGNIFVGRINTLLMTGLVISYICLIFMGAPHIEWPQLLRKEWGGAFIAVPLLLTIFSFQTMVPSLTIYLKQDAAALRKSIFWGTTIALIVYLIWEALVLGTVLFDGDYGLAEALAQGKPATEFLKVAVGNPWVGSLAEFFAFFAIVTSFLGIALGLHDFLADGLKISRVGMGNILLTCLIAGPILFLVFTMERPFMRALDATGGIGDSILNGIIPALMLWIGRYHKKLHSEYRTPGGKVLIVFVLIYAVFVLTIELLGKFGVMQGL